jgi:hypothetical protein
MNTEKQVYFRLEDNGDSIKVDIQGTGEELINLLAQAMSSSDEVKTMIQFAFLGMMMNDKETQNEDDQLAEVLSQMKMGEA